MHPIRKTLYLIASYTIFIPFIGLGIILIFAAYADYKGWDSKDIGC
jgi:hypothetical protein